MVIYLFIDKLREFIKFRINCYSSYEKIFSLFILLFNQQLHHGTKRPVRICRPDGNC